MTILRSFPGFVKFDSPLINCIWLGQERPELIIDTGHDGKGVVFGGTGGTYMDGVCEQMYHEAAKIAKKHEVNIAGGLDICSRFIEIYVTDARASLPDELISDLIAALTEQQIIKQEDLDTVRTALQAMSPSEVRANFITAACAIVDHMTPAEILGMVKDHKANAPHAAQP